MDSQNSKYKVDKSGTALKQNHKTSIEQFENFKNHLGTYVQLSNNEFESILKYFTFKKLKKHDCLVREGDYVICTYWVKKGLKCLVVTLFLTFGFQQI